MDLDNADGFTEQEIAMQRLMGRKSRRNRWRARSWGGNSDMNFSNLRFSSMDEEGEADMFTVKEGERDGELSPMAMDEGNEEEERREPAQLRRSRSCSSLEFGRRKRDRSGSPSREDSDGLDLMCSSSEGGSRETYSIAEVRSYDGDFESIQNALAGKRYVPRSGPGSPRNLLPARESGWKERLAIVNSRSMPALTDRAVRKTRRQLSAPVRRNGELTEVEEEIQVNSPIAVSWPNVRTGVVDLPSPETAWRRLGTDLSSPGTDFSFDISWAPTSAHGFPDSFAERPQLAGTSSAPVSRLPSPSSSGTGGNFCIISPSSPRFSR